MGERREIKERSPQRRNGLLMKIAVMQETHTGLAGGCDFFFVYVGTHFPNRVFIYCTLELDFDPDWDLNCAQSKTRPLFGRGEEEDDGH